CRSRIRCAAFARARCGEAAPAACAGCGCAGRAAGRGPAARAAGAGRGERATPAATMTETAVRTHRQRHMMATRRGNPDAPHDLDYASRHTRRRGLNRVRNLRRRLGAPPGLLSPVPPRPRYWNRAYHVKLLAELAEAEAVIAARLHDTLRQV